MLYGLLYYSDPINHYTLMIILIFFTSFTDTIISNSMFVAMGAFNNRICDTVYNFGRIFND